MTHAATGALAPLALLRPHDGELALLILIAAAHLPRGARRTLARWLRRLAEWIEV